MTSTKASRPKGVVTGGSANWIRSTVSPRSSSIPAPACDRIPSPHSDGIRPKLRSPTGVWTSPHTRFGEIAGRSTRGSLDETTREVP